MKQVFMFGVLAVVVAAPVVTTPAPVATTTAPAPAVIARAPVRVVKPRGEMGYQQSDRAALDNQLLKLNAVPTVK